MKITLIILGYLRWHYGQAFFSLISIWKNFLYFVFEYFSIKLLFVNFFDPWKRMADSYSKKFELKKYFYTFIANLIMRTVGMIMRLFLIIVGLTCYILLALLFPVAVILWVSLPLIILILILAGSIIIIK